VPTILFLRILPNIPPIQNNRSFISTKQNKTKQNKTKQNKTKQNKTDILDVFVLMDGREIIAK
jgi:uncharacterized protein YacL